MSGPKLFPKNKTKANSVYLEVDRWARLSALADFHSDVFVKLGAGEKVSRNDIIESFLDWAEREYWAVVGGPTNTERERTEKINQYAEIMKSEREGDERSSKTHCSKGHALTGANLRIRPDGKRACRECQRAFNRKHEEKLRQFKAALPPTAEVPND